MRMLTLIIGALLMAVTVNKSYADTINLSRSDIVRVYDGDTFTVNLPGALPVFGHELGVRIAGIDTPELVSHCGTLQQRQDEKVKALIARQLVVDSLAQSNTIRLTDLDRDKYFRLLARVEIDGRDLGDDLIDKGLADPYSGGTKIGWCGR